MGSVEQLDEQSGVRGYCVLTMPDRSTRRFANRRILRFISDVRSAIGPPPAAIPPEIYAQYPELVWFRDCISARSSDGSSLYQLVSHLLLDEPAVHHEETQSDEEPPPFD